MKKKDIISKEDYKTWDAFTRNINEVEDKDQININKNSKNNRVQKLDLHGYSLDDANKEVKKFIIESFNQNYENLLIVTGKGSRSKSYDNPYISEKLSVLRYSVPEFIRNDVNLENKISRISTADMKDGGAGAIYIFLKNNKKLIR